MNVLAQIGSRTTTKVAGFGDFCRFCGRNFSWCVSDLGRWRMLRLLLVQMYEVGTRSVPVVMITGAFVGMVLAAQSVLQFKAIGMEASLGAIVNLSVVRELGPVLAAIMIAGRVGGALAAELGTMRVTEQIDALRAMGTSPIRVLVVPRFLACVLLIPIMVIYADFMGILGGYGISVYIYGVNRIEFWRHAAQTVEYFDIFYGPIKSVFFGSAIGLICCYKGFHCQPGAAGVGRACTESFVASCMAILALDLFLGMFLNTLYEAVFGVQAIF